MRNPLIENRLSLMVALLFGAGLAGAQEVAFIKAGQIERWKNADTDTIYVLNFWATWCGPCVAELPEFEKLQTRYAAQKVKVVLITTDFKKQIETRVKPFLLEHGIRSQVAYMDETNPNTWIDLVNPGWSGLIPATLIIARRKNVERFFEGPVTYETLETTVEAILR